MSTKIINLTYITKFLGVYVVNKLTFLPHSQLKTFPNDVQKNLSPILFNL